MGKKNKAAVGGAVQKRILGTRKMFSCVILDNSCLTSLEQDVSREPDLFFYGINIQYVNLSLPKQESLVAPQSLIGLFQHKLSWNAAPTSANT